MQVPVFISPEEHRLYAYYKKLNNIGFALIIFILLINELFIRKYLASFHDSPHTLLSLIAFTLNARLPISFNGLFLNIASIVSVLYMATYLFLPRWGSRAAIGSMKKGLPKFSDYKEAYFYIENRSQALAFYLWHSILMRISLFFGIFTIVMAINLFRDGLNNPPQMGIAAW